MAKNNQPSLLAQILAAHESSGGAVYPKSMDGQMRKLEREGLIERHVLGNGKLVARITNSGRKSLDFLFAE